MNKKIKLSNKELQKCLDELQGTNFLNAFCVLDWVLKTRQENKELHNKIDKLEDKIKQMDNRFKNGLCIDNYLGGRETRKLFEEMYEILKESDVDDNG